MNHEQLRLIANPNLLVDEPILQEINSKEETYLIQLNKLISNQYNGIFLSEKFIMNIDKYIYEEIDKLMIQRIIQTCINDCINKIIEVNKFDFIIPFE